MPKLNTLRLERSLFIEQQSLLNELERQEINLKASTYCKLLAEKKTMEEKFSHSKGLICEIEKNQSLLDEQYHSLSASIKSCSPKIIALQEKIKAHSKELSSISSNLSTHIAKAEVSNELIATTESSLEKLSLTCPSLDNHAIKKIDCECLDKISKTILEISEDLLRKERQLSLMSSSGASSGASLVELDGMINGNYSFFYD